MPLPERGPKESNEQFIDRCMGDDVMVREFPDAAQRRAVCEKQSAPKKDQAGRQYSRWYDILPPRTGGTTTKVKIYEDIGGSGLSAKEFVAELDAVRTPEIDLHISSYGGEIVDGLACYKAIKNHPAKVTVHIDSLAASVASVVAMAGKTVKIAKNAFVMIHEGWGFGFGSPADLRKQAEILDKLCNSIAEIYAYATDKSVEECRTAMAAETWFNAQEAKAWGLVDEIEDDADEQGMAPTVLAALAKYQKAPPALRTFAAQLRVKTEAKGKERAVEKIVCRDDKWFLGEAEVDVSAVLASGKPAEAPAADEKALAKARAEGLADGRKAEAAYRAMFNAVVSAVKLDPASAAEFEKTFYGRAEEDLKFLASHAIGQRAKPLGETGIGNAEGEELRPEQQVEGELQATCTKRFSEDLNLRRMFGLSSQAESDDPSYQAALKRYVVRERQWAKDQKTNAGPGVK